MLRDCFVCGVMHAKIFVCGNFGFNARKLFCMLWNARSLFCLEVS